MILCTIDTCQRKSLIDWNYFFLQTKLTNWLKKLCAWKISIACKKDCRNQHAWCWEEITVQDKPGRKWQLHDAISEQCNYSWKYYLLSLNRLFVNWIIWRPDPRWSKAQAINDYCLCLSFVLCLLTTNQAQRTPNADCKRSAVAWPPVCLT